MSLVWTTLATHVGLRFYQNASLMLDEPSRDLPALNDYRWSEGFTGNSWGALLVWVILLIALQWASWPVIRRIFSRLPDRGWSFARPVSLLLSGLMVWYPVSLGLIQFRAAYSIIAILLLGVVAWTITRRIPILPGETHWTRNPVAVTAEWVFWIVFIFFVFLRSINPDSWHPFWGGEKPMEFAHLNAILRSGEFPPVDPWYAGGYLNYYYFGTYLVAHMIKATGIPAEIAFNLATPLFPAMLAAGAFSIGATFGRRLSASTFGAVLSGLASMFFVSFAGNLVVATRLYERAINKISSSDPFTYWVWAPTRAIPDPSAQVNITEFPYFGALYADLHPHIMAMPYTLLLIALGWQIAASWRTLPVLVVKGRLSRLRLLSFIAPMVLAGVTLGAVWMINAWDLPMYAIVIVAGLVMLTIRVPSLLERLGIVVAASAAIGIIAVLTSLPFNLKFQALFGDVKLISQLEPSPSEAPFVSRSTPLLALEGHLGAQILICTMGSLVLLGYVRGLQPKNRTLLATLGLMIPFGLLLQWLTRDAGGGAYRIAEAIVAIALVGVWTNVAWQSADDPNDFNIPVSWLQSLSIAALASSLVLVIMGRETLAVFLGIGLSAVIIWVGLERQSARFVAMLIAGGALLGGALEIVYLVDDLQATRWYRMNTVFKFYNQIWNLFGIACGVIVGVVIWRLLVWEEPARWTYHRPPATRTSKNWMKLAALVTLPIMALMGTYLLVATPIRLDQRFGDGGSITLNAYSWMEYGEVPMVQGPPLTFDQDRAAINWLNDNVEGTPIILEASFGTYRCNGSRISINTGLPTVIGWVRHEMQQRPATDLKTREDAVRAFYTDPDQSAAEKRAFLDQYDVDYVVVGVMERQYPDIQAAGCTNTGDPKAISVIEGMVGSDLEIVWQQEGTTIYRVIRENN